MNYAFIAILFALPNVYNMYYFEIELFRQRLVYYYHKTRYHVIKKCQDFHDYFYPKEEIPKVEIKPVETYENKYKSRFCRSEQVEEDLEKLKNNILFENTPNGNLIMFYDSSKKVFEYYSDKSIPYRFLNSAARKYVVQFHCKNIYLEGKEMNSFAYLGKIANFSFLKKVEKGVTNKKLNMSFKDFKNMKL